MARDERRRPHGAPAMRRARLLAAVLIATAAMAAVATATAAAAARRRPHPPRQRRRGPPSSTRPATRATRATPASLASRRTARRPPTRRKARPRSRASPRRARRRPRANRPAPSRRRARRRPSGPPRSARPASPAPPCPASPGSAPTSPPATSALGTAYWHSRSTATELRVDVANTGQAAARFALLYTLPAGVTDAGTEGCAPAGGQSYRCSAWTARAGAGWSMRIKVRVDGDAWKRMPLMGSVQVTASAPGSRRGTRQPGLRRALPARPADRRHQPGRHRGQLRVRRPGRHAAGAAAQHRLGHGVRCDRGGPARRREPWRGRSTTAHRSRGGPGACSAASARARSGRSLCR